jgi:hypothetical protein
MQHRHEHRPFHRKAKLSLRQQPLQKLSQPQPLPQPLEDQGRSQLPGLRRRLRLPADQRQGLRRILAQTAQQPVQLPAGVQAFHPPQRGQHPLTGAPLLPFGAHQLQISVGADAFDSGKHRCLSLALE